MSGRVSKKERHGLSDEKGDQEVGTSCGRPV